MAFKPFNLFLALALWSLSTTQLLSSAAPTQSYSDPCTSLLRYTDEWLVPARDAYACLRSPKFVKTRSRDVYEQMRKFSLILSSQAFHKNPEGVTIKISPVDLNGTLDAIEKKIDDGGYGCEYEFNTDLMNLFGDFHDGHTYFAPNCPLVFGPFIHSYPLVSITDPGTNEVKIYLFNTTTGDVGQEIVEIAGQPAIQHLLDLAQNLNGPYDAMWIDEDTRWNALFGTRGIIGSDAGHFAARDLYPGDSFQMKTKSGQVIVVEWYVAGPGQWTKPPYWAQLFQSTESYYKEWCLVKSNTAATPAADAAAPQYEPTIHKNILNRLNKRQDFNTELKAPLRSRDIGAKLNLTDYPPVYYPDVVKRMIGTEQSLHIMKDHPDVAVWGIHTFMSNQFINNPDQNDDLAADEAFFKYWKQYTIETLQFIAKKGIKRLVLDLSSNGGGLVYLGLDTVRCFFPTEEPFYGVDYRRTPFVDAWNVYMNTTAYLTKVDGSSWKDVNEYLNPPVAKYDDYFTKIGRLFPLKDIDSDPQEDFGSGEPPFSIENLVILTDGKCASTCVIAIEAFVNLGVATVVTGGEPVKQGPKLMQHTGGTKGYQVIDFSQATSMGSDFKDLEDYYIPKNVDTVFSAGMNFRNSYTPDEQIIPQEFLFQPADGHLWYTEEMLSDRTVLWDAVINLTWDESGKNKLIKSNNKSSESYH